MTDVHVVVEKAQTGDAAMIAEVHRDGVAGVSGDEIAGLPTDGSSVATRGRFWAKWLARSQAATVVARMDGQLIGFCAMHPAPSDNDEPVAELVALYVHSSHWRQGVGHRLWNRIRAEMTARGFSAAVAWVLETNEKARSFYGSLGFQHDGATRILSEEPGGALRELRYRRTIPPVA